MMLKRMLHHHQKKKKRGSKKLKSKNTKTQMVVNTVQITINLDYLLKKNMSVLKLKYDSKQKTDLNKGDDIKYYIAKFKENKSTRIMKEVQNSSKFFNNLLFEFQTLKNISHPNIVKAFDYNEVEKSSLFVYETSENSSLKEYLQKEKTFDESTCANIIYQLIYTIGYLHSKGIAYLNLNLDNISFVRSIVDIRKIIRIENFSKSRTFKDNEVFTDMITGIPDIFIAPEILNGEFNEKVDIWMCGILLYFMLFGSPPFLGKSHDQTLDKIVNDEVDFKPKFWESIPKNCKEFLLDCLEKDYKERKSADELIIHPWFEKYKFREKYSRIDVSAAILILENMHKFTEKTILEKIILLVILHNLAYTKEQDDIYRAFYLMDDDGDGFLNMKEFEDGYLNLYSFSKQVMETNESRNIFKKISNSQGLVDFHNFAIASIKKDANFYSDENLKIAFKFLDPEMTGRLKLSDLERIFGEGDKEVTNKLLKRIFTDMDLNSSGDINYEEFRSVVIKNIEA